MEVFVDDPRCPPVPRNYKVYQNEAGQFYAMPGEDKRKQQGRVNKDRPKFFIMEHVDDGRLEWIPEKDYNTRHIREFMLKQGLEMEIKFNMKMTAKAPKVSTILRQEYGMTGTPLALYMQFCKFRSLKIDPKVAEMALAAGEIT